MIKIILKGDPKSNNHIYRRHKFFIYMSKEGKALKADYQRQAREQYQAVPFKTDLEISIELYFGSKRKHDIDNYGKILLDSLTGIIWEDDNQISSQKVSKFYAKENPRIEIKINKIDLDNHFDRKEEMENGQLD